MMSDNPPAGITVRPAVHGDDRAIRSMIRREHLNPLGVDWRNFWVAEDPARRIVGIGAVKTHGDSSRELASIAVAADRRGRGIAGAVIRAILERERGKGESLYLTCRERMTDFYERFGFRRIDAAEMPPYFRRLYTLFAIVSGALRLKNRLTVMKRGE